LLYCLGGMVVKVFGVRTNNCSDLNVACSRVLLLKTSFSNNRANQFGPALVVTKLDGVLVSCDEIIQRDDRDFITRLIVHALIEIGRMKKLNSTSPCPSWHGNELSHGAEGPVIGTFGHKLNIEIDSIDGHKLFGDAHSGFVLSNVSSGQEVPRMVLTTLDAFGGVHAPTLHERDAILLKAKGFLQQTVSFSFMNGTCIIEGIVGFVKPGNYTIHVIPRNDDVLEAAKLTLVVRNCHINEQPTRDGTLCERCGEASYNFSSSGGKCASCPEGANCSGTYIVPSKGYWHNSPCHDKVKKCIIEEACNFPNRTENLAHWTQNFTDCNFNNETLHEYEEAQCNEVSMSMTFQNVLLKIAICIRATMVVYVEAARNPMKYHQALSV